MAEYKLNIDYLELLKTLLDKLSNKSFYSDDWVVGENSQILYDGAQKMAPGYYLRYNYYKSSTGSLSWIYYEFIPRERLLLVRHNNNYEIKLNDEQVEELNTNFNFLIINFTLLDNKLLEESVENL